MVVFDTWRFITVTVVPWWNSTHIETRAEWSESETHCQFVVSQRSHGIQLVGFTVYKGWLQFRSLPTSYTPYSARMSPENAHKLIGLHIEVLILGVTLEYIVSASKLFLRFITAQHVIYMYSHPADNPQRIRSHGASESVAMVHSGRGCSMYNVMCWSGLIHSYCHSDPRQEAIAVAILTSNT